MASFSFDTSTVKPSENSFDLLPAGEYFAHVTESEVVPLKSGNGTCLKLTVEILQDGYRGRKVWARLNVQHSNPQTEEIAQQQLRQLCEAIGLSRFEHTEELHGKPFIAKIKISKSKDPQYQDSNDIAAYKPASGGVAHSAAPRPAFAAPAAPRPTFAAPAAPSPAPAPVAGKKPWEK